MNIQSKRKRDSSKREAILTAALDLLVEYDIQATAMSRIAIRAQVGMGTIYNYFESKEVLLYELFRSLKFKLRGAIYADYPEEGTHQEQFFHVWRQLYKYHLTHPKEFLFAERFAASPYVTEQLMQESIDFWEKLNKMFDEAQAQQAIKEIRLEYFLPMVHGSMSALVRNHINGLLVLDDDTIEMAITNFWDSIKYSPS